MSGFHLFLKYKSATLVNKFMKLILAECVFDQLCDTNQWRGFFYGKTVKEIGLSQLHNLVAAIVGKCNMEERFPPTDPSSISFGRYLNKTANADVFGLQKAK